MICDYFCIYNEQKLDSTKVYIFIYPSKANRRTKRQQKKAEKLQPWQFENCIWIWWIGQSKSAMRTFTVAQVDTIGVKQRRLFFERVKNTATLRCVDAAMFGRCASKVRQPWHAGGGACPPKIRRRRRRPRLIAQFKRGSQPIDHPYSPPLSSRTDTPRYPTSRVGQHVTFRYADMWLHFKCRVCVHHTHFF